jgi:hypothetical protein
MGAAAIVKPFPNPRSAVASLLEKLSEWAHSPRGERILGLWPWLLLLIYTCWATSPLWQSSERGIFAGKVQGDNIVSPWFYGWVARSLESGASLELLADLNYPSPWPRGMEFPNVLDATLTAPLWWFLEWPQAWGASQAMTVFVTALGCAALARALGCRGLGILVAGMLGVLCRELWHDLTIARVNAAWPGLALISLAALIAAIRKPQGVNKSRRPIQRTAWALLAGATGALAASVYPPYLVLLAPAGLILLVHPLHKTDRLGWGLLLLGLGSGLLMGWGEISSIIESRGPIARMKGFTGGCPNRHGALLWSDISRGSVDPQSGLSFPGLATGSWMLMGLVLLHKRRLAGIGLMICAGLLMVLSLGPCPRTVFERNQPEIGAMDWESWPLISGWLPSAWDMFSPITDWGRMATIAALLAAICAGLGIERLWQWGRTGKAVALVLSGLALSQAHQVVMTERMDPHKWWPVPAPQSAVFLQTAEVGPVADLPFDSKHQFLSILWAPDHPRINPLRPADHPPEDPFIKWLYNLSRRGEFTMELGDTQGVTGAEIQCTSRDPGSTRLQENPEVQMVGNRIEVRNLPEGSCTGVLTGIDAEIPVVRAGMDLFCTVKAGQLACSNRKPSPHQVQASGLRWVIVDQPRCGADHVKAPVCSLEGKEALRDVLGEPEERDGIQIWDLSQL